jgi:hypothetical protein
MRLRYRAVHEGSWARAIKVGRWAPARAKRIKSEQDEGHRQLPIANCQLKVEAPRNKLAIDNWQLAMT